MCPVKSDLIEVVDVCLPRPPRPQLPQKPQVVQVPDRWLRSTAPLEGTTLKQSPFSPARAKVDKVLEIEGNNHNPWGFVTGFLTALSPAAWASLVGLVGFTSILTLASKYTFAPLLAQGDPFFGSTTIVEYIALEELKGQCKSKKDFPEGFEESSPEKSPGWFEIEGKHAYMFPEKNIFYWAIEDSARLGLRSGQIGRCIDILDNGMLLLRFNEQRGKTPIPIFPGREKLDGKNLMEVAKYSDFVAIDREETGKLLSLFPCLQDLSL